MAPADVDWLIPHQANIRIIEATAKKMGMPMARVVVTVDQHGNTSAASVPLALDAAVRDGRIQRGQKVMLEGVGGGLPGARPCSSSDPSVRAAITESGETQMTFAFVFPGAGFAVGRDDDGLRRCGRCPCNLR